MSGKAQNAIHLASTLAATTATKKVVDATWKLGSGKKPPADPTDPDTRMREAVVWAVLSGAAVSVARVFLARRFARNQRHELRLSRS